MSAEQSAARQQAVHGLRALLEALTRIETELIAIREGELIASHDRLSRQVYEDLASSGLSLDVADEWAELFGQATRQLAGNVNGAIQAASVLQFLTEEIQRKCTRA